MIHRNFLLRAQKYLQDLQARTQPVVAPAIPPAAVAQMLEAADGIVARRQPYAKQWEIIDTSTADPEVNWPGGLVEEVEHEDLIEFALQRARIAAALTAYEKFTNRPAFEPPSGSRRKST